MSGCFLHALLNSVDMGGKDIVKVDSGLAVGSISKFIALWCSEL